MARYEAGSQHRIYVLDTVTDVVVERWCDAAWWINTPDWAQLYIMEGMRQELVSKVKEQQQTESEEKETLT